MKKIFIFGYYGFNNLGDDASLHSIIQQIRSVNPNVQIYVLTYKSKHTSRMYNVNGISRNHYYSIINSIIKSDIIISGGGTLLQDITSKRSLIYYLMIILISKLLRKKVIFFSNGFGPIQSNKYLTKKICNIVDEIILRDSDSKEMMKSLKITNNIKITSDVTFLLKNKDLKPIKNKIAISLRTWKKCNDNFYHEIAKFVNYLIANEYEVVFVLMEKDLDMIAVNKIMENVQIKSKIEIIESEDYVVVFNKIAESYILIGMRLHAGIFALINNRPIIMINYDPKVNSLTKDFNQLLLNIDEKFCYELLRDSFCEVINNYNIYAEQIDGVISEKKELLEYNYEVLRREVCD